MTDPVELTQELVGIPSANPPGDELACARFIHEWCAEHGLEARLIDRPSSDRPSVAARVGEGSPVVVLNGHTDVVPAGDTEAWRYHPYEAVVDDGRLYGRGAADMKAGLAVAMTVADELSDPIESGELSGSLIVHAAAGEETGYPGTETLIEAGYGGDMAIVLEPTDFRVATSAKGVATFRFETTGRSAHASRPEDGDNAIDGLRRLIDALDGYDEDVRQRVDPLVGRGYATVTEVRAGIESNMAVIPDRAALLLDRRMLPGETLETVEDELVELQHEVTGTNIERSLVAYYEPAAIDPDHRLANVLRRHTAEFVDVSTDPWGLEAATDARSFIAAGTDAVIWGPGSLEQAHTVDEMIDIDDITLGVKLLSHAVAELLANG